jgi:hypothetical protein
MSASRPYRRVWHLVDHKDQLIERWSRDMSTEGRLATLDLTARQRRVIARLHWAREYAKACQANGEPELTQQPPPVAGIDANGRVVVQCIESFQGQQTRRMWTLNRDGSPNDIKEPVHSLRTGDRVRLPAHIHTIQERDD